MRFSEGDIVKVGVGGNIEIMCKNSFTNTYRVRLSDGRTFDWIPEEFLDAVHGTEEDL